MQNKTIAMFGIAIAMAVLLAAGTAFAYQSQGKQYGKNGNGMNMAAIEQAIESGDFEAWKELHEGRNGRMMQLITAENFYLLKEMHEAREAGDFERVNEIKEQLGFPQGFGKGQGKGRGMGFGNCPHLN